MNQRKEDRMQKTEYSPPVLYLRSLFVLAVVLFLAIGAVSPVAMGAKSLPGPAIPDGFGVNIHFTGLPRDLKMIANAGFKFIRMDLAWSRIEKTKGEYDFKGSGYDSLTQRNVDLCHSKIKIDIPHSILTWRIDRVQRSIYSKLVFCRSSYYSTSSYRLLFTGLIT